MYIDPNTGGTLFQILAVIFAAFSGIVLVFSSRIKKLIAQIQRRLREKGLDQDESTSQQDLQKNPEP